MPDPAPATRPRRPRGKRPLTADDLYAFAIVSDPRPSPDGRFVAYVVTRLDKPVSLLDSRMREVQSITNRCLVPSLTPSAAA